MNFWRKYKTRKTLKKARDLIVTRGWARGVYVDRKGAYCAVGALKKVTGVESVVFVRNGKERLLYDAATSLAKVLLAKSGDHPVNTIIHYNDYVAKCQQDVVLAFDSAIEATR